MISETIKVMVLLTAMLSTPLPNVDIESPIYIQPQTFQVEEKTKEEKDIEIKNEIIALPDNEDNAFKTYMDYRAITDMNSKQWKLQQEAYTDEYGMRKVGDYYCVALGSAFSKKIGTKFIITLENGEQIKAILADQKSDLHTDKSNKYMELSGNRINIVEFIVDMSKLESSSKIMGDVSHISHGNFDGKIISIEKENTNDKTNFSN